MDGISVTYQTRGQILDSALTIKEGHSLVCDNIKNYKCSVDNLWASVKLSSDMPRLSVHIIRLQLLIRVKLTEKNINYLIENRNSCYVSFDLSEYMRLLAYDEEQIADSTYRKNVARDLKSALNTLHLIVYKVRNGRTITTFNFVNGVEYEPGYYKVRVAPELINLLISSATYTTIVRGQTVNKIRRGMYSKFTTGLLSLRSINDMLLQFQLDTHASMKNNIRKGTSNTLGVKSIAKFMQLPTEKAQLKNKGLTNYFREMLKPILTSLESLKEAGFIEYYLYEHKREEPLSEVRTKELLAKPELFLAKVKVCYNSLALCACSKAA